MELRQHFEQTGEASPSEQQEAALQQGHEEKPMTSDRLSATGGEEHLACNTGLRRRCMSEEAEHLHSSGTTLSRQSMLCQASSKRLLRNKQNRDL